MVGPLVNELQGVAVHVCQAGREAGMRLAVGGKAVLGIDCMCNTKKRGFKKRG